MDSAADQRGDGGEELAGAGVLGGAAAVKQAELDGNEGVGHATQSIDDEELVVCDVDRDDAGAPGREPQPHAWKLGHSSANRTLQRGQTRTSSWMWATPVKMVQSLQRTLWAREEPKQPLQGLLP